MGILGFVMIEEFRDFEDFMDFENLKYLFFCQAVKRTLFNRKFIKK